MIKNITNEHGGEYVCRANELNKHNTVNKLVSVKVQSQYLSKI